MDRKGRNYDEEIPGSKRSMHGYILTYSRKGEPLSSVFSTGGTLISASAAPHCGVLEENYLACVNRFIPLSQISSTCSNIQDQSNDVTWKNKPVGLSAGAFCVSKNKPPLQ